MLASLAYGAQLAIAMYSVPVEVADYSYLPVRGIDTRTLDGERTIEAAVELGARRLEQIFGGTVADGDIGLYTSVELYYPIPENNDRRQSFVRYKGFMYRIVDQTDYTDQTGTFIYRGTRHVEQDLEPGA